MNPEQLLSQLQPLRAPDPVGFWPMAPVWWLLLIAAALAATVTDLAGRMKTGSVSCANLSLSVSVVRLGVL